MSNIEEVKKRGEILEIDKSKIRTNTFILTFKDGSQCNVNGETLNKINK
jgi:hypothetical protein